MHGILVVGVQCVVAAPNCALWGNMTANMRKDLLQLRRDKEEPGLRFLGLVCFLQHLLGRNFILESSGASKIFEKSSLSILGDLGLQETKLDQCMFDAAQDEIPVKKSTKFVSNWALKNMDVRCDKGHDHQRLRGQGQFGSRTAAAAQYPTKLCNVILDNITSSSRPAQQDGGE